MRIDREGNLVLAVAGGATVQQAPAIDQRVDGQARTLAGPYAMSESGGWALGAGTPAAFAPLR